MLCVSKSNGHHRFETWKFFINAEVQELGAEALENANYAFLRERIAAKKKLQDHSFWVFSSPRLFLSFNGEAS